MVAQSSVLERLLHPEQGDLPPEFAQRILALDFDPADHARYLELSEKSQHGTLTAEERVALNDLLIANDVLIILRAKAQLSLHNRSSDHA
ncbi:MAG TPA: hypothetical protein VGG19_11930 [Tepidisphaeraceae bacterium]|jgi:hypothetical protein